MVWIILALFLSWNHRIIVVFVMCGNDDSRAKSDSFCDYQIKQTPSTTVIYTH